jgi:hypothetical protein
MSDNQLDDYMNSDRWKEYEKRMLEKQKHLKKGPNVVHLHYLGSMFSEEDFKLYEKNLTKADLEFSRYDQSGDIKASFDLYELVTFVAVTQPIINEIIKGVGSNVAWDAIKLLLYSGWKRIRGRKYSKYGSRTSSKKEISFGLKVPIDDNTAFDFKLNGDLDEDTFLKSLDMILEFLDKRKPNSNRKRPNLVYFDKDKNEWIEIDVDNEIKKLIQKN